MIDFFFEIGNVGAVGIGKDGVDVFDYGGFLDKGLKLYDKAGEKAKILLKETEE